MTYAKTPCKNCPYRKDKKPYLTKSHGADLAHYARGRFNDFPCHKTMVFDEESEEGEMMCTEKTKTCAGFLTLMAQEIGEEFTPNGFKPSYKIIYESVTEMISAHEK